MNFSSNSYTRWHSLWAVMTPFANAVLFFFQVFSFVSTHFTCMYVCTRCAYLVPSEEGVGSPELELDGSEHTGRELVLCMNKGSAPGH